MPLKRKCFDVSITRDIWTWSSWLIPCPLNAARIIFLQNELNFSALLGYTPFTGRIRFEHQMESYDPLSPRSSDWSPSILYCRTEPRLPRGWPVWLSPFNLEVWVIIGLTGLNFLAFQFFQKGCQIGREISYFMGALFRQGYEISQIQHIVLVLMCIILSTAYETLFTSQIIAPVSLPGFENVGQFVNNSDNNKLICVYEVRCKYLVNDTYDIRSNFAKYGVLGKLEKHLVVQPGEDTWLSRVEEFSGS